tara:strand:+ start:399 stop:728 length:330 start_codon:yes stop_codon:yes gene_type:complete
MEGACVYRNSYNNPTLVMYKEYYKNRILVIIYYNYILYSGFVDCKTLTNILPKTCEHILTKLPIRLTIQDTIKEWKRLAVYKLIIINYEDSKNNKNNFTYKFKNKNNFF